MAVGAVILLVVVVAIVAVALTRNSSSSGGSSTASTLPEAGDVQQLLHGIPQHGNVLGSSTAPARMVEYIDLQCPFCREFETQVMPSIIPRFVRTGKVQVEMRPLDFIGPDSVRGRNAAIAAGQQDRMFNFAQLLYDNQGTENTGWLNDTMVRSAAKSIPGVDVAKLEAAAGSSAVSDAAKAFDDKASADNVRSTPTILVGRRGQTPTVVHLSSPTDEATLVKALQATQS
jgi:protein-disulfide isomerase